MKPLLLDRYLARQMARPFGVVIIIVIMLLSLENTTRLLGQLENVEQPVAVLAKFMAFLLPEYLAIALIFALFIAVSMSLRKLALSGEFDIFAAVGLSPARMLRTPMIAAGLCACLLLLTRGYLEPWGERRLEEFGAAVRAGELGMAIKADEFYTPSNTVTFYADRIDAKRRRFNGVMVRINDNTMFAQSARIVNGGRNGLLLILQNGQLVTADTSRKPGVVDFAELRLPAPNDQGLVSPKQTRRRNNRQSLNVLLSKAAHNVDSVDRQAARSGLAARFAAAFALPLLPLLATGLCIPPKRQAGALGIGLGLLVVVGFVQGIDAFEDSTSATAPLMIGFIWTGLALFSGWSWRVYAKNGPGYLEGRLSRWFQPILDRLAILLAGRRKYA